MQKLVLNIEQEILHDVQLVDTQMVSVHCDVDTEKLKESDAEINISIISKGIAIDNQSGKSIIEVKVQNNAFELSIIQEGKFKKDSDIEIEKEKFENFLATQGIRLLWSFARENVYEISCKMLRKPIMLPTLDVLKTLKK